MKIKKLILLCAALSTMSLMVTGCQNGAQTEEEIVIPKEEESQDTEDVPEEEIKTASGGAIAEQVQAPERFEWEGGSAQISVKVDADIVIPEREGFQSYKVTSRPFTQEDYDKVSQILIKGEKLWDRDLEAMAASNGWTAAEIEERIERLETQKAEAEANGQELIAYEYVKPKSYDEMIDEWKVMKEKAPDEMVTVEVSTNVIYNENSENTEESYIMGTATVEGTDYFVSLDNNLRDDWKYIEFKIRNEENNSNFSFGADENDIQSSGISIDEIRQKAQEDITAMDFADFAPSGEEYVTSVSASEESNGEAVVDAVGYGIHFTRLLDGIPVTYTHETGSSLEGADDVPWPYEELTLVYTRSGFAEFSWRNPYIVEKTSEEYVFLLPFSEIQKVFEEMMVKKYEDFFGDTDAKVDFTIDRVQLGYMRVMERGNTSEAKMVPVWDFFGSETLYYPDMEEPYTVDWPYESWLTINALDGTIIDRGLGY